MNPFPRWLAASLAAATLLLLAGGGWFYRTQERHLRIRAEKELQAIAELKVGQIAAWRADQLAEAGELMSSAFFIEGVARAMASRQVGAAREIRNRFRSLQEHYNYTDVLLVDMGGKVCLSLAGRRGPLHAEAAQALSAALRDRKAVLTDLHAGAEDSTPHLGVIAPLSPGGGSARGPIGAVILQIDPRQFLYPLIQSWPVPSRSSETLLVRRDGDSVLFLNELRHRRDTALKLRIPLSRTNVPAVMGVLGKEGVVHGADYRGVEVLSVVKAIPDSPWVMVAKVDAAEALEFQRFFSVLILALILVLIAAAVAAVGVVWQRNAKTHYQALFRAEAARRESEERHRMTLMSVGDGVLATDAQGRVELLNPVAEALTGWSQKEACGKPLEEVFLIVNEETRKDVENPVSRVVREGLVVGLANHTLLIARDGTERPIADSGAPIRNDKGEIAGVVLVFRDQTEERAAGRALHESEERYRRLFEHMREGCAYCEMIFENGEARDFLYLSVNRAFETLTGLKDVVGKRVSEVIPGIRASDPELFELYGRVALTGDPEKFEIFVAALGQWFSISVYCPERGYFVAVFDVITDRKRAEEERESLEAQFRQSQKMEAVGRLAGGVAHDFNNILQAILGYVEMALHKADSASPIRENLLEIQKAAKRAATLTRQLLAFARKETIRPRVLDLNDMVSGMLKMLQRLIGEDIDLAWKPGHDIGSVKIDPSQIDQLLANLAVNARDAIAGVGKVTIETGRVTLDEAYCAEHVGFVPGEFALLAVSDDGCGMDKETLDRIFEPFFTTKRMGEGTGLGLATVYGIVKQNGAFINVYSEPGKGTTFRIYFPRLEGEAAGVPAEHAEATIPGGVETVLLVEDDEVIRNLSKAMLERLGYTVLIAGTPANAIRHVREHAGMIHLLITDVVMPEMNGRQLAELLATIQPGLKCLYMSGYTANVIAHRGILAEGVRFLQKPFSLKSLAEKVQEVLDQ